MAAQKKASRSQIIMNADDFGITEGVNRAILELLDAGVMSSTSVMTNMPSYGDIVHVKDKIGIGVHFNLTVGSPVASPDSVPSIVDQAGNFLPLPELLKRMKKGELSAGEVEGELVSQVCQLVHAGIQPDHVDSHESLLKYPFFMRIIKKVARQYGVKAVRTYSPRVFDYSRLLSPRKIAVSLYLAMSKIAWQRDGFKVTDAFDSLLQFGLDHETALGKLTDIFRNPAPGVLELGVHPGYCNGDNLPLGGYVYEREAEFHALLSEEFLSIIRDSEVEFIRFSGLQ